MNGKGTKRMRNSIRNATVRLKNTLERVQQQRMNTLMSSQKGPHCKCKKNLHAEKVVRLATAYTGAGLIVCS